MFPIEKYKFYTDGTQHVYAVSTYAGKVVRGSASCDPKDEFSLEKGKELAAARCALKIANKRLKRASQKEEEAYSALIAADNHHHNMEVYLCDAYNEKTEAEDYIQKVLSQL